MKNIFLIYLSFFAITFTSCNSDYDIETQFYSLIGNDAQAFFKEKKHYQNKSNTPIKNLHSFDFSNWEKTNYKSGDILGTHNKISFFDLTKNNSLQIKNTGDTDAYFWVNKITSDYNNVIYSDFHYLKANEYHTIKNISNGFFSVQGYSGKEFMQLKSKNGYKRKFAKKHSYFLNTNRIRFDGNDFVVTDIKDAKHSKIMFNPKSNKKIISYEDPSGNPLTKEQIDDYNKSILNNSRYTEKVILNNDIVECVIVSTKN